MLLDYDVRNYLIFKPGRLAFGELTCRCLRLRDRSLEINLTPEMSPQVRYTDGFERRHMPKLDVVTFTQVEQDLPVSVAVPPEPLDDLLGQVVAEAGKAVGGLRRRSRGEGTRVHPADLDGALQFTSVLTPQGAARGGAPRRRRAAPAHPRRSSSRRGRWPTA